MKLVSIAFALTLMAIAPCTFFVRPALAQGMPNLNLIPDIPTKSPEEKEADEKRDKAYRDSLKKIPDAKSSSDPWGVARSADAPKTTTPTMKKTKSGSNAN